MKGYFQRGTLRRLAIGALAPVALVSFLAAGADIPRFGWDATRTLLVVLLVGYVYMGLQSLLYTCVMEFWVNPRISSSILVVLLSTILGVLAGLSMWFSLGVSNFGYIGAGVGFVVGVILRWDYSRYCRDRPLFDFSGFRATASRCHRVASMFAARYCGRSRLCGVSIFMILLAAFLLPFSIYASNGSLLGVVLAAVSVSIAMLSLIYRFGIKAILSEHAFDALAYRNPFEKSLAGACVLMLLLLSCSVAMFSYYGGYLSLVILNAHVLVVGVSVMMLCLWLASEKTMIKAG